MNEREATATALLGLLKSKNEALRCLAAQALGRIGEPGALEPLAASLQDEDEDVCHDAAQALGRLGDRRAVAPLREFYLQCEAGELKLAALPRWAS